MTKIFTILCALVLSVSAVASDATALPSDGFQFHFFGNSGGRTTYISCDYAVPVAEEWLLKFGAKNVQIRCTGGITSTGAYPLSLRVDYTPADVTLPTGTEVVKIETDMDHRVCDYDTQLMRTLLNRLPNIKAVSKRDYCFSNDSRYEYEIAVTTHVTP